MFARKVFAATALVSSPPAQRRARLAPALYSASAKGIGFGLVLPMLDRPAQIPGAGLQIRFRIEQFFRAKIFHFRLSRPFRRGFFAHLHQAAFTRSAEFLRVESALPPDDRFHQHRVELMLGRDRTNERVVLLKTRRADPFVERVERIARAHREIGQRPPLRREARK